MLAAHARRSRLFVAALVLMLGRPIQGGERQRIDYTQESWTQKAGLPGGSVWALAQDQDGYLWLAMDGGLVRFDGVRFVEYSGGGRAELPNETPRALCATRDGSLWIGFWDNGGIARLRRGQTTIYSASTEFFPGGVRSILEDRAGTIWAGGGFGLASFQDDHWAATIPDGGSRFGTVSAIYEDRQGGLWIGGSSGVYQRSAGTAGFRLVRSDLRVLSFTEDGSGHIWTTGFNQFVQRVDGEPIVIPAVAGLRRTPTGSTLTHDRDGNVWSGTFGAGVWLISPSASRQLPELQHFDRPELSNSVVRSLLVDREDNLWVGTDNGLNRISTHALSVPFDVKAISQPVNAITSAKDGSVWVGSEEGLYQFAGGRVKRHDWSDGGRHITVTALHVDARGTIWVAGEGSRLARFTDGRFVSVPLPHSPPLRIRAITSDPSGAVWVSDFDWGVFQWQAGTLTPVFQGALPEAAYSLYTDRSGQVWLGLADRIVRIDRNGQRQPFTTRDGLSEGRVLALYEDYRGTLWAGTTTGLCRFETDRFVALPLTVPGRPTVNSIVEDQDANLWLGVSSGVVRMAREDLDRALADAASRVHSTFYDTADGLHGVPKRAGAAAARASDGTLWFVTSDGLTAFNPHLIRKKPLPPPVRIERLTADDRELDLTAPLQLPPSTTRLQIDYTGLSFTAPSKVHFRYRLEGFDTDWVEAGTRRYTFYTNLPPRAYRFHVTADNDGVSNESSATLEFAILPAYYQTNAFRLAVLSAVSIAVWIAWRRRVNRVRQQFDLVLAERTRMGREIHDTLLQSLIGVTLQFDTLRSHLSGAAEFARDEIDRLRKELESCVRDARKSILDLRSPIQSQDDLETALRRVAEQAARRTGMQVDLTVTGTPERCAPRVHEQLLRIGQEAVMNTVRHAKAKHVALHLSYDTGSVVLSVKDDGLGFDQTSEVFDAENHWGLASMHERAEQIGAEFRLTSSPGAGTEIEIVSPVC
jgi:signal transduction histidine kinase/ligand-binding sensor domain-containing protein